MSEKKKKKKKCYILKCKMDENYIDEKAATWKALPSWRGIEKNIGTIHLAGMAGDFKVSLWKLIF